MLKTHKGATADSSSSNPQEIIPYSQDGGIAKLSCNGVSLTASGEWLLPIWREIGGGAPCQNVSRATKKLHGVAAVLISSNQVRPPVSPRLQSLYACMHVYIQILKGCNQAACPVRMCPKPPRICIACLAHSPVGPGGSRVAYLGLQEVRVCPR